MTPTRIQRKNTKGWRMPENTVCVSPASAWENPYRVKPVKISNSAGRRHWAVADRRGNPLWFSSDLRAVRAKAVELYRELMRDSHDIIRSGLAGKNLCCWCDLDVPCHGDFLLEVANR